MPKPWSAGDELLATELNAAIKWGGDASDGALDTSGGVVNIDFGNEQIVTKNYSSINIATNNLTFTNPHVNGTLLILRSTGNVTISADIELTGAGANNGTTGFSILDTTAHYGEDGDDASGDTGGTGSGEGGVIFDDNLLFYVTPDENRFYRKFLNIVTGSGGGDGGSRAGGANGGDGGYGGGGLIIECGGALDFSGNINVDGKIGTAGIFTGGNAGGGGGGGGGSAGMALVMYNSLTANTGTINARGGAGGAGATGGPNASTGAGGGGEGGGGGGSYTGAGSAGGNGGNNTANGTPGTAGTGSRGAGGGGGGGAGSGTGGTGGSQGTTDSNHYLIVKNNIFS